MADTWSFDATANTFTLALDGSGTGQKSRSQTFGASDGLAADTLYTWRMPYTTDTADVEPFLEVDGGDRDTGTGTSGTLQVSGTTDGSANITLRFGVAEAGAAPSASTSEALDYATEAAAVLDGWTVTNDTGNGTITFGNANPVGAFGTSIRFALSGSPSGPGLQFMRMRRTFALTASAQYRASLWVKPHGGGFVSLRLLIQTTSGSGRDVSVSSSGAEGEYTTSGLLTPDPDGLVLVTIEMTEGFAGLTSRIFDFAGLTVEQVGGAVSTDVTFSGVTYCEGTGPSTTGGTGAGPGDGEGGPGDDAIPDPPPGGYPPPASGGARPFGNLAIPAEGLAYWNQTVKAFTPTTAVNLINVAGSASTTVMFKLGPERDWLVGGKFSYAAWEDQLEALYADVRSRTAINTAIASAERTVWGHWLVDEPFHPTRFGPGGIPFATVERMAQKFRSRFPDCPIIVRVDPTDTRMPRAWDQVDIMWGEYHLARGDVTTYKARRLEAAQDMDVDLIFGIHYYDFGGVESNRFITPSELRHYGGILASTSVTVGMGGWEYRNGLFVPGFLDALRYVRDLYASYDP